MEKVEVLPLVLYKFKLPDNLLKFTLNKCNNDIPWNTISTRDNEPHYGSYYKGEKSSLHRLESWNPLTEWFQAQVDKVSSDLNYIDIERIKISQMWANRSTLYQWHHLHHHPNSVLSGILYVKGSSGKTLFSRKNNYDVSKKYPVFLPDNGSLIHKVEPEIGTALLFPSSLHHSVDENMNAEDRITVSFNTFFWGKIGGGLEELDVRFR